MTAVAAPGRGYQLQVGSADALIMFPVLLGLAVGAAAPEQTVPWDHPGMLRADPAAG